MASASAADKKTAMELVELAKSNSVDLRSAITGSFDAKDLKEGTAWRGMGRTSSLRLRLLRNQCW